MRTLLNRYRDLLAAADAWFSRCQAVAGDQLQCASGCTGCCRGLFDITLLDALVLREELQALPFRTRNAAQARAQAQLDRVRQRWPAFAHPFLLNDWPEEEWELPEEDAIPCCLLAEDGRCLAYAGRPLTCRLHGLPHVDRSGEIFLDEWCTLNFPTADPLSRPELRGEFRALFAAEADLLRQLAARLGRPGGELDTLIPAALFLHPESL